MFVKIQIYKFLAVFHTPKLLILKCMILFWYFRVSPQTELDDDNARNEKETKKLDSEQNSKEKVKSSVQGLAPGLGYGHLCDITSLHSISVSQIISVES